MGYGLEACEGVPPQKGVISAVERGHVEEELFGPVVIRRAEYYIKFNFPQASCFSTGDDASKGGTLCSMQFVSICILSSVSS